MGRPFAPHVITDDSALGSSVIEKSLRFNPNANLTRTSSSTSTTFTYSVWIKRCQFSGYQYFFSMAGKGFAFHTSNNTMYLYDASSINESNARFRDPTAWYHIVVQVNSGTATSYVNNVLTHNAVGGGAFTLTTGSNETRIGSYADGDYYFNGYMAEIHLVDGSVVAPTSFGFTDSQTGIWMPRRYEGSYGNNGFRLDFSDNSSTAALGIDKSPNGNDFTTNNFSVSAGAGNDSLEDTPTNNFCTLNPLDVYGDGVSEEVKNGNLDAKNTDGGSYRTTRSTFHVTTGKWYWEVKVLNAGSVLLVGVAGKDYVAGSGARRAYNSVNGQKYIGSGSSYGASFTTNDIIGIALDLDNGTITFYKNGVSQGVAFTDMLTAMVHGGWTPIFNGYGNSEGAFNFGQRAFDYTPPSGHLALCSKNIPPKNIPSVIRPQKHFESVTYSGTGSTNKIESLEFAPDLVWVKRRDATNYHILSDTIRGAGNYLVSNTTDAESSGGSQLINGFLKNGFQVGTENAVNNGSGTYVAWCWKAGGSSNTFNIDGTGYATAAAAGLDGGTIDPTGASINTEAGFSIITYTGNGTAGANVAHGLGKKPAWIIIKARSVGDKWFVYHHKADAGAGDGHVYAELQETAAFINYPNMLNDTAPTDTLVTLHSDRAVNGNGDTYVMYSWAEIPGYSKFGIYTGNGNSDGIFVDLGFRPAFVLFKKSDSNGYYWEIRDNKRDSFNPSEKRIFPNTSDQENSSESMDFLSNGFKLKHSQTGGNASGGTYVYMAFAEEPGTTPFDTFPNAR